MWFKYQRKTVKNWWENNQESVKDEVARIVAILTMIIFSPLIILVIILMLIISIDLESLGELKRIFKGEKIKEFFKKFIKRLRQCAKEIAFYCNVTNLPYSPTMSEEERRKILKTDKYEK